jgi:hypothetical protein
MLRRIVALLTCGQLDDRNTAQSHGTDTLGNLIMEKTATGITRVLGKTLPTDALAGYAPACLFQHTDGGAGSALYVNEGTATSCDFDLVTVA